MATEKSRLRYVMKNRLVKILHYICVLSILFFLSGCGLSKDANVITFDGLSDSYSSQVLVALNFDIDGSVIDGGNENIFLGKEGAYNFKKHLYDISRYTESYDEILSCNSLGVVESIKFDFEHQIYQAGYAYDTDGYIGFSFEEVNGRYEYELTKHDFTGNEVTKIKLDFLTSDQIRTGYSIASDVDGYWHVASTRRRDDIESYYVLAPNGDIIFSTEFDDSYVTRFILLPDGHIACDIRRPGDNNAPSDRRIGMFRVSDNEFLDILQVPSELASNAVNIFNNNKLVYATCDGVFVADFSLSNKTCIYSWDSNAIDFENAYAICMKDEELLILYETTNETVFQKLISTAEDVETIEITFAVADTDKRKYSEVVNNFNKNHPNCKIRLQDGYESSSLTTQLISGDGPVIVDTKITGFSDKRNLWLTLGSMYEEAGLDKEMSPAAIRLGSVDGEIYAVVTDCFIETAVTCRDDISFDYEGFINSVEDKTDIRSVAGTDFDKYSLAVFFFDHGIDNSYYVDKDENGYKVNENNILRVIDFVEKFSEDIDDSPEKGVKSGEDVCNGLYITKPEELLIYEMAYGDDAEFVGYPGKNGATNLLYSRSALAIRKSADDSEKDVAITFLKYLMSEEVQRKMSQSIGYGMSSRLDVLERQIDSIDKGQTVSLAVYGDVEIKDEVDNEHLKDIILSLSWESEPCSFAMDDYKNILSEEFDAYFSGAIAKEKVANNISNRLRIYIGERE